MPKESDVAVLMRTIMYLIHSGKMWAEAVVLQEIQNVILMA